MATQTAHRKLLDELDASKVPYELIPHRHAETALAEAEALGVHGSRVAKTVVLTTPDGLVRAVVPASERLDLHKVRELIGTTHVELATEEALAGAYPDFELGAVPPLAGPSGDRVLLDGRLAESPFVVFAAGTHDESVRIKTSDLIALTGAMLGDLCRVEGQ
jgi:Ala-tRNA(Pro) deacylase